MSSTRDLVVNVIGWKPHPDDPSSLAPQFANPVAVRIYTTEGIRPALAWLRLEGGRVIAATALPPALASSLASARLRCFCCTLRELEPRSKIERRRITSIDICVETGCRGDLEDEAEQPVE